jgi:hypothetical protein
VRVGVLNLIFAVIDLATGTHMAAKGEPVLGWFMLVAGAIFIWSAFEPNDGPPPPPPQHPFFGA